MPQVLGSADPIRTLSYLPGIQTTSELESGIRINGCDNSHNNIAIGDIPVYGSSHMLGLFSVFNPTHFSTVDLSTYNRERGRIGGSLVLSPERDSVSKFGMDFNVGLISSHGTMRIPVGKKSVLRLSGRGSYLNLLYGKWLEMDNSPFRYSLADANLGWTTWIGNRDRVDVDFYFGQDRLSTTLEVFDTGAWMKWGNLLGGVHWVHDFDSFSLDQSLYATNYGFDFNADLTTLRLKMDAFMRTYGYKADLAFKNGWKTGVELMWHEALPQNPSTTIVEQHNAQEKQNGLEGAVWVGRDWAFAGRWKAGTFLKGQYFLDPERRSHFGLAPVLDLTCNFYSAGAVTLRGEMQNQYLFQTGMSNLGFPIEFWVLSGKYSAPQTSLGATLSYKLDFLQEEYGFSADLYYKRLFNQVEYYGSLMDMYNNVYKLEERLISGDGRNFGFSMMFHKRSGNLTGWISYSYGRALRWSERVEGSYPSSHERIHELNVVAMYRWRKWDFGATFVVASGTPFTPAKSVYVCAGKVFADYASFNSAHMPPYLRLDLSVNYSFNRGPDRENGINFSLYNVTCQQNPMTYRVKFKKSGAFQFAPMRLKLAMLPSISYYHKF